MPKRRNRWQGYDTLVRGESACRRTGAVL